MEVASEALDNMRLAIGLLSAARLDHSRPAPELLAMMRSGLDEPGFDVRAITGLVNVATILLLKLEELIDAPGNEVLEEIAMWIERTALDNPLAE